MRMKKAGIVEARKGMKDGVRKINQKHEHKTNKHKQKKLKKKSLLSLYPTHIQN